MSKPKWTPGPWIVSRPKHSFGTFYIDAVAAMGLDMLRDPECSLEAITLMHERNVHLIAAAPALYEALTLLLDEVDASGNGQADDFVWPKAISKSVAALAAARGES